MRTTLLLFLMLVLTGCGSFLPKDIINSSETTMVKEEDIVLFDEERSRKMDKRMAEYIEENRQIVFTPDGWQIMAYCDEDTIEDAFDDETILLCEPPESPDIEETRDSPLQILTKGKNVRQGKPVVWYVRYDNRTKYNVCVSVGWQLMDIQADTITMNWHYVSRLTQLQEGELTQQTWKIDGRRIVLDFSGHVSSLYVKPANDDGTCFVIEE